MSQQLFPVSGGVVPEIQTTTAPNRLQVLSPQYIAANNLESRPTEWGPGGRPIYGRLPATGETYRINFFNVVTESNVTGNTSVRYRVDEVGYVYVPWGASINGAISSEVVSSDNDKVMIVKGGEIVWKYGKNPVRPSLVDLESLDVLSGRYSVAYQLIYDDSPQPKLYSVEDYQLTGIPLNITSSADQILGWRYPAVNAFLNSSYKWSNEDTFFPDYAQPTEAFLQWESELTQAYTKIVLRFPAGTSHTGTASLSYVDGASVIPVGTVTVSQDAVSQFFQFDIPVPSLQLGWKVSFSDLNVSIDSVTVSGALTILEPQASPSPRAALVMCPVGTLPKEVELSDGRKVPAIYATLANIDVGTDYTITKIEDTRDIIHRDYVPVADWLTKPFDSDLTNLYEQVSGYSILWMQPSTCLNQEYANLITDRITVEAG